MKTIQRIAVALIAALIGGGLFAAPAHADRPRDANVEHMTTLPDKAPDTRPCVTNSEYAKIRIGMPRTEVETILDGPGARFNAHYRTYKVCTGGTDFVMTRFGAADRLWQSFLFNT